MHNPVVVKESFTINRKALWDIITQQQHMTQWFFENIPDFKAEVGFATAFDVKSGTRIFPHRWKIMEVIPLNIIVYDWKYEGFHGHSIVTFEMEEKPGGSSLTVTHKNTEPYPQNIPEFSRESCLGGWNYFIKERLKSYLSQD